MYRGQVKKPVLVQVSPLTQKKTYIPEKIELINLLSSYIKDSANRNDIYTALAKLKTSIS